MTALEFLISLRPAIPFSVETPCKLMSNGELRRHIQQGGVLINTERVAATEQIDFPVFSVVFFPDCLPPVVMPFVAFTNRFQFCTGWVVFAVHFGGAR